MTSTTTDANVLFMLYLYDMATVFIKSYQTDALCIKTKHSGKQPVVGSFNLLKGGCLDVGFSFIH